MSGYHVNEIIPGVLGQSSKIQEELDELKDAENQGVRIMVLHELADLYGSIQSYLEVNFPEFTMQDLKEMSDVTRRAFICGHRQTKN